MGLGKYIATVLRVHAHAFPRARVVAGVPRFFRRPRPTDLNEARDLISLRGRRVDTALTLAGRGDFFGQAVRATQGFGRISMRIPLLR